jgi:hypothetical protein
MQQSSGSAVKNLDRAGMSASLLCAVHCAFLPLLFVALPAFGLAWLDSPVVDWSMFGIGDVAHEAKTLASNHKLR